MNYYKQIKTRIGQKLLASDLVQKHMQYRIKQAYPATANMGEFRENDIFIVGYPKSGNTWMQNLVAGLVYGVQGDNATGRLVQELVPDVHYKRYFQRFGDFTCFKSHSLPQKEYRNVIYIVRDGRDALASYWHFLNASRSDKEITYSEIIEDSVGEFGNWSNHYSSWQDNPFGSRLMFLRYEDLLHDGISELKRVCEFIGINRSENDIDKINRENSFSNIKEKEQKFGFGHNNWNGKQSFFRKGKSGSYHEELPEEIILKFNEKHRDVLSSLNYEI